MVKEKDHGVDRRTFIKSTAAGAGVIAASVSGFIGKGRSEAGAVESAGSSFETPPPPIPASEIRETVTTEVVVVGAGTAGMAATLSAAEAGARVILIDKHTTFRAVGGYNGFIGSRLQKKLGFDIDPEEVIRELMKYGGNKPDQRLIRLWAYKSPEVIDWLLDMAEEAGIEVTIENAPFPPGIDWRDEINYKEYPAGHLFGGHNQRNVLKILQDNALKNGADIRYQINALQLIRKEKGRVSGLIAKDKNGDYIQFNTDKGVILCTGDYGSNPEMMEKYCPWAAEIARKQNSPFPALNTGDGHRMAMQVGAVMELPPHAPMDHVIGLFLPMGMDAFLRVNILGERYENEDVPGQSMANSLFRQPEWKFWQVFDAKWPDEVSKMGIGLSKIIVGDEAQKKDLQEKVNRGICLQADSIEELATKMKVPLETFKKTIARYNELARLGKDLDFGKRVDRLTTVEKPPFYAGSGTPTFLIALGGMNVNPNLQALDAERKVIPGLYLAGNTAGGFFANDYPTMIPGLSHGRALTFGYIAGKNAAAE